MADGGNAPASHLWQCGPYRLVFERALVMGIVNLTDDSFSGDGVGADVAAALAHAERQRDEGADILDLGAESTRPGAAPAALEVELARLLPVLRVVREWGIPISVDTRKPEAMRIAIAEGAAIVNDIFALRAPEALSAIAAGTVGICLMHMQGEPRTMQTAPSYRDVVAEVGDFLAARLAACRAAGIAAARVCIDPGFGFGKTHEHNFALLRQLDRLAALDVPLLVGLSRKAMLGAATGRENGIARMPASIAAAVLAVERGAAIVRVHDVAATRDALAILATLQGRSFA